MFAPAMPRIVQASECRDLFTDASPRGLRAVRITDDDQFASSHIYMEAPVFTPDGSRFVFQRVARAHYQNGAGQDRGNRVRPREYWLCDISDGFALRRLTDEPMAIAPAVSPDGAWLYYFVNNLEPRGGACLRRVSLDSFRSETVMALPGVSRIYPLATIRADGGAVATGAFLDDRAAWGVIVCDIAHAAFHVACSGPDFTNPHPQYSRSTNPDHMHDLLVQENVAGMPGCRLLVVRDDASHKRYLPCGDPPQEVVHGHQEWRGAGPTVLVGVDRHRDGVHDRPVLEIATMPDAQPQRNDITRDIPMPMLGHTAIDITGSRFVTDTRAPHAPADTAQLAVGSLHGDPASPLRVRYLLHPRSSFGSDQFTHPHPTLSPDGMRVLFNTDHGGLPQIWMVEGFEYP